jgi:hypothetical protein
MDKADEMASPAFVEAKPGPRNVFMEHSLDFTYYGNEFVMQKKPVNPRAGSRRPAST